MVPPREMMSEKLGAYRLGDSIGLCVKLHKGVRLADGVHLLQIARLRHVHHQQAHMPAPKQARITKHAPKQFALTLMPARTRASECLTTTITPVRWSPIIKRVLGKVFGKASTNDRTFSSRPQSVPPQRLGGHMETGNQ